MLGLIDTHCHLDFEAFDRDRLATLERAWQAGVKKILNLGIDVNSSLNAMRLAEASETVYAAVGIHPNSDDINNNKLKQIKRLAKYPIVVAIGEIGLDYYREYNDHAVQKKIFKQQLDIAAELELPVIVHNRQADMDVEMFLMEWHEQLSSEKSPLSERPGVLHSFSSSYDFAQKMIERNFFIGISGPITYNNGVNIRELVKAIPLEKVLIETDAPFLTPHPYRGKRNEPAYVIYVGQKIAELHALSVVEIATITSKNAGKLFNW